VLNVYKLWEPQPPEALRGSPGLYMNSYQVVFPAPFQLPAGIFSNRDIRPLIRVIMYRAYLNYLTKFQEWIFHNKTRKKFYIDICGCMGKCNFGM
jgi:hypothetical protein